MKSGLMTKKLLILLVGLVFIPACNLPGLAPVPTLLPAPSELGATPLPTGSQVGGLDGIYVSRVSVDGYQDERCYNLYRFYPDGLALYAEMVCFDTPPDIKDQAQIEAWFERSNPRVWRGDYSQQDNGIWLRIVIYDEIHEETYLRYFQGEYCAGQLVLQEPAVQSYTGIPSPLTQPVVVFRKLDVSSAQQDSSSVEDPFTTQGSTEPRCNVAGFEILFRPSVTLSDGKMEYRIRTDPGETCTLQYTLPDGSLSQAHGTGTIQADRQGLCKWVWETGPLKGKGIVTVSIDQITQDFEVEIR